MSPADNVPNFDAMTPEEIMAWMESLAKRQGASSDQFTTSADLVIPEIDPDSVVIDEPGYVPSEGKSKGKKIETVMPTKRAEPAPEPPRAAPVMPPPEPIVQPPAYEPPPVSFEPPPIPQPVAAAPEPNLASMSWLESLAADQGSDFPQLDLSSLAADLTPSVPPTSAAPANPIDWLENLAQSAAETTPPQPQAEAGDPMAWLESLAKRQGVQSEELITDANIDVPMPEGLLGDGPGYTDYTVDSPGTIGRPAELNLFPPEPSSVPSLTSEPATMEDPAAWLDSLASAQGFGGERKAAPSDDDIQAALNRGEVVPPDQMEAWMSRQLELGAQRPDPEEVLVSDPDEPAVRVELPDWLIEQVGEPPDLDAKPVSEPSGTPALIDAILEPPPVANIPDWLKEDLPAQSDLDSIFASPDVPAPAAPVAQTVIEVDANDPWVEAFDMEYAGKTKSEETPEWYVQRTTESPAAPAASLAAAALEPEKDIPAGEPEALPDWLEGMGEAAAPAASAMPDWLQEEIAPAAAAPVPAAGDIPDWLRSVDVEAAEVPDWLKETLGTTTGEQRAVTVVQPTTPVTPAAPPPAAVVPVRPSAPVPVQAANIDAAATLSAARSLVNSDFNASLANYELLIRANAQIDVVTDDLLKLADKVKNNAAVLRVLGDSLMRQGKLQAALDTYRKALNQL
ncbi:MAG: tetratricopeptide repeat protein [Anaerolineae bacterium]|nr:tetratricopeptide repeat protein [Anaerolineae bacterium]